MDNNYQYGDLPLIPHSMPEYSYSTFGSDQFHHVLDNRYHYGVGKVDERCYNSDTYDNGMVMNRWMQDQYPMAQGVLQMNVPAQHSFSYQHELQFSTGDYQRQVSPCSSGKSTDPPHSEFHSPHTYCPPSHASPKDIFSHTIVPYPTTEQFQDDGYMSQTSLNGGCSLRELEYNHVEPVMDDSDDTEMKEEKPIEHEHVIVPKIEAKNEETHDYIESRIENSVRDAESVQPIDLEEDPTSDSDYSPRSSRSSKRRRSSASSGSNNKVSKRRNSTRKDSVATSPSTSGKGSRKSRGSTSSTKIQAEAADDRRHFPCPLATYGCISTFSSKNEWKRHVSTQHIKLGFWRCDLCAPTTDPHDDSVFYYNDFNRKDLFTQHLRRMHAGSAKDNASRKAQLVTDDNLAEHQTRCLQQLRKPPQQSVCLYCDKKFAGPSSWEERMEHVGKHLEKDKKILPDMLNPSTWNGDKNLDIYLVEEGLVIRENGSWRIGDGKPNREAYNESESEEE